MNVNVTHPIIGYDGEPFQEMTPDGTRTPLDIRWAIRNALNVPLQAEPWTPDTMIRCADISKRAFASDDVDLDEKDRTFIQERSAKVNALSQFGPMIHMALVDALTDTPTLAAVPDGASANG